MAGRVVTIRSVTFRLLFVDRSYFACYIVFDNQNKKRADAS